MNAPNRQPDAVSRNSARAWSIRLARVPYRWCLVFVALLACTPLISARGSDDGDGRDAPPIQPSTVQPSTVEPNQAPSTRADERPTILLTGFEPFGAGREPNPAWEGIKSLDNRKWKGYRLVSRQMNVVWGAPRDQLQKWIAEFRPTAILSFGQGGEGSFALESQASNARGRIQDNNGELPPTPSIVKGGPEQFKATTDCQQFARSLAEKGYPIRVSARAGQYLCEEALYTLEYLKAKDQLATNVLFCHVPPLNSEVEGKRVDVSYIQRFVEDALETWYVVEKKESPAEAVAQNQDVVAVRKREIEKLIRNYFTTWSNQDIDGYGKCFADKACVQSVDSQGQIELFLLTPFLASQKEAHRRARNRLTEVPESIDISLEAKLARVVVYWKLTSGAREQTGYDHFTLIRSGEKWKIINLVFYESELIK